MLLDVLFCQFHQLLHFLGSVGAVDIFDGFHVLCDGVHHFICMYDGGSSDVLVAEI
jgi:hypothetical protein